MEATPHIVILPSPGMGHLIPLTEFAKKLVCQHNISITFIISTSGVPSIAQKLTLESLPQGIDHISLPPIVFEEQFEGIEAAAQVALTVVRSLPSFCEVFKNLVAKKYVAALIADPFTTHGFDVAKEFEIPSYLFFTSPAMSLCWSICFPQFDETVLSGKTISEPVHIPGCVPVSRTDFMVDPVQHRHTEAYRWTLYHSKRFSIADGIIVNTFADLEPGPIEALRELSKSPVYPIGPIVRAGSSSRPVRAECLEWLDNQPSGSVLFVSFGSGGTLSYDQVHELALGLELSEHRFVWAVKSPNDSSNASYFSVQSKDDPLGFLPKGFVDRTKGRSFVLPSWAPQVEILSHSSIGGFITHCGWNSILESIVNGVPLIVWPLYAEQFMNAVMLVENLKVAVRPKMERNGVVGREEIAKVVKTLFEGEEGRRLHDRMLGLKDGATKALSKGGSSTKSLIELALIWKNYRSNCNETSQEDMISKKFTSKHPIEESATIVLNSHIKVVESEDSCILSPIEHDTKEEKNDINEGVALSSTHKPPNLTAA